MVTRDSLFAAVALLVGVVVAGALVLTALSMGFAGDRGWSGVLLLAPLALVVTIVLVSRFIKLRDVPGIVVWIAAAAALGFAVFWLQGGIPLTGELTIAVTGEGLDLAETFPAECDTSGAKSGEVAAIHADVPGSVSGVDIWFLLLDHPGFHLTSGAVVDGVEMPGFLWTESGWPILVEIATPDLSGRFVFHIEEHPPWPQFPDQVTVAADWTCG